MCVRERELRHGREKGDTRVVVIHFVLLFNRCSNMRIHNLKEPVCKWASNANVAYIVVCGTLFATIDHKDALAGLSIDVLKKLILVPATWVARPAWLALFKNDAEKIKVSLETHALYYNQIPQFTPRR